MPWTVLRPFAAAALAAVLVGCTIVPVRTKGVVDVPLQADATRAEATAAPRNEVRIHLAPLKDARNHWGVVLNDTRFLRQLSAIERNTDGTFTVSFVALKPGRRTVRLLETPAAGRETVALQTYEVIIEIE